MTASISALGAAGSAKANYCQSQISAEAKTEGYYQNSGRDPAGEWHGQGLQALGLKEGQKITDEDFANILRGRDAQGNDLVQGAGDQHRGGWDIVLAPPKGVSVLMAIASPELREKIFALEKRSVQSGMQLLQEEAAFARRGHAGAEAERLPGLAVATYNHIDSRNLDPQMHTHCLIMNLAQRVDGTYGGIESLNLFRWKHAVGAVYRAEMVAGLKELGFEVQADGDFFKIKGLDQNLVDEFSSRRKDIEAALKKAGLPLGNSKTSQIATLATRVKKQVEITRDQLFKAWQEVAKKFGWDSQKVNELAAGKIIDKEVITDKEDLEPEPTLLDKLTQNESCFEEQDLWKHAAIKAQHQATGYAGAQKIVNEVMESGEIVKLKNGLMTTKDMLKIETKIALAATAMHAKQSHAVSEKNVNSALDAFTKSEGFELSKEQQNAVKHVTNSNQLAVVRGAAGAGKSTMLRAANSAWKSAGFTVIGCAISGKAAAGLQDGSTIKSQTIHSLLFELEQQKKTLDKNSILVVDEAGMVDSRQMEKLIQHVEKAQAKLVLVGDERQLQPIQAGGAFKLMQAKAGFAELNEVRRQKDVKDIAAAQLIADGRGDEALLDYVNRGKVTIEKTGEQTRNALVADYISSTTKPAEKLALAGTRAEVYALNQQIRTELGIAGTGHTIKTKTGKREFAAGDRIMITKNVSKLGLQNGHFGTVQSIRYDKDGELKMSFRVDGQSKNVDLKVSGENAFENIDHGYSATVHKSQSASIDKIFFLANANLDKQLSYVAMTRHRDECKIYSSEDTIEQIYDRSGSENTPHDAHPAQKLIDSMAKDMKRDNTKNTAYEHQKSAAPPATPAAAAPPATPAPSHNKEPVYEIDF